MLRTDKLLLSSDNQSLIISDLSYKFGLLDQCIHLVRWKSFFIMDLCARLIVKYPKDIPRKVVCQFGEIGQTTLGYTFSFRAESTMAAEGEGSVEVDWMRKVLKVCKNLVPKGEVVDDEDMDEMISLYAKEKDDILDARRVIIDVFEEFGARDEVSDGFDRMLCALIDKASFRSLYYLVLIMGFDSGKAVEDVKEVEIEELAMKDLPLTLIVNCGKGGLKAYKMLARSKDKCLNPLKLCLEIVFGSMMAVRLKRILSEGEVLYLEDEDGKLGASSKGAGKKKKKKKNATDSDYFKAFAKKPVCCGCLN